MPLPSPRGSLHADRMEIRALRAELAREVETRENANAVSVRVEAENRLLVEELELAAEQGRLVGLEADRLAEEVERLRGLVEIIATNLESVMPESAATIRATLSKEATSA